MTALTFRTSVPLAELTPAEMTDFQRLLQQLGYSPGPIDGQLGPQTRSAYQQFLDANNLHSFDSNMVTGDLAPLAAGDGDAWQRVHQGTAPAPAAPAPATAPTVASAPSQIAAPVAPPALASSQPYTPPAQGSTDDQIRSLYPNLAYLLDVPQVGQILRQAATEGWDAGRLQGALFATDWWKTTQAAARVWDNKMAQDPASANAEWDQKTVQISNMMLTYGIQMPDTDAKWLAGRVIREGWTDEQLMRFMGGLIRDGHGITPGKITDQQAKIKAMSLDYMVNLDDASTKEWAARIVEGTASMDAVESYLRKEAINRFSWLKPEIEAGLSPSQLFGNIRNTVAQTLEIDPSNMDLNSVKWSQLITPITGTDGKLRSMNYNEAQKWARSQTDWRYTKNAMDESSSVEMGLLKTLGVLA